MQADVARDLIKAGVAVQVFSQRSVAGILPMIKTVGRVVGAEDKPLALEAARPASDIVVGSSCGKRFRSARGAGRAGWHDVPAVRRGEVREAKSALIPSPSPVAMREGLPALAGIIARWAAQRES